MNIGIVSMLFLNYKNIIEIRESSIWMIWLFSKEFRLSEKEDDLFIYIIFNIE